MEEIGITKTRWKHTHLNILNHFLICVWNCCGPSLWCERYGIFYEWQLQNFPNGSISYWLREKQFARLEFITIWKRMLWLRLRTLYYTCCTKLSSPPMHEIHWLWVLPREISTMLHLQSHSTLFFLGIVSILPIPTT